MAGVLGFEPRDAEIKTRCLTAWRYPKRKKLTYVSLIRFDDLKLDGWGTRIRT